jgi:uncharacterized protein YndB with AHSA1/START domain
MQKQLIIRNSIVINASPARVWNALVNPEQTKKYMFGCETVSDWKVDGSLLWKANYEGKETIFVKGNIVEIEDERFLAYTTIDPNAGIADIPENYLTVTYELSLENGQTVLTVTQGDFTSVEDGERRYREAIESGGWDPILQQLKELLEKS